MSNVIIYARRLAKGTSFLFVGFLAGSLAGFFFRIFLANSLEPADYGLFFSVFAFISFVSLAQIGGFGPATAKYISEFQAKKRPDKTKSCIALGLSLQVTITTIIAICLIFLSNSIAIQVFNTSEAAPLLKVMGINMIIASFLLIFLSLYQGFQNMAVVSLLGFSNKICVLIFSIMFISFLHFGVSGVAFAHLSASLVTLGWGSWLLHKYWRKLGAKISAVKPLLKPMSRFALLATAGMVGAVVLDFTDVMTIQIFHGAASVGYYQVARPLSGVIAGIGSALNAAFLPMASELWAKKERQALQRLLYHMLRISFVAIIPIMLILMAFPEIIIRLLFSEAYLPATPALVILAVHLVFYIPWMYMLAILGGIGRPGRSTQAVLTIGAFNLVGNLLLVPHFGIAGAALTTLLAYILGFVIVCYFIVKFIEVPIPWGSMGKCMLGGWLTLGLIFVIKTLLELPVWFELVLVSGIALLFYLVWLWITRVITREDSVLFKALLSRWFGGRD